MELELVRMIVDDGSAAHATMLMPRGATREECIQKWHEFLSRYVSLKDLAELNNDDIIVIGRVPFHQEDAFTLRLTIGDML